MPGVMMTLNDRGLAFLEHCGLDRERFFQTTTQNACPEPIVLGVIKTESAGNPGAMRFEKDYPYLCETKAWAQKFNWTQRTEETLQRFSFGLMQIMLATARSLDFSLHPQMLLDPNVNVAWGCYYLRRLFTRHMDWHDAVSAYNAGHPYKALWGGKYKNQPYVDTVYRFAAEFQA